MGESSAEGAARETLEEAGAKVQVHHSLCNSIGVETGDIKDGDIKGKEKHERSRRERGNIIDHMHYS